MVWLVHNLANFFVITLLALSAHMLYLLNGWVDNASYIGWSWNEQQLNALPGSFMRELTQMESSTGLHSEGRLLRPYSQHFKIFVTYKWTQIATVLVPSKAFQYNEM
jgi:hypothetical protein